MRWWRRKSAATRTREVAEARAEHAEQTLKRPLREMRERNHLADALIRALREGRA